MARPNNPISALSRLGRYWLAILAAVGRIRRAGTVGAARNLHRAQSLATASCQAFWPCLHAPQVYGLWRVACERLPRLTAVGNRERLAPGSKGGTGSLVRFQQTRNI